MKKIKFRVWDKINKKMFPNLPNLRYWLLTGHNVMQYTGRKDKNGIELYNEDILEYVGNNCPTCGKHDYYKGHGLYMISWDDSTLSYECMEIGGDNYMGCDIWGTDMVKVGSRYENPELLEGKENGTK